jgi:hypothetical protein
MVRCGQPGLQVIDARFVGTRRALGQRSTRLSYVPSDELADKSGAVRTGSLGQVAKLRPGLIVDAYLSVGCLTLAASTDHDGSLRSDCVRTRIMVTVLTCTYTTDYRVRTRYGWYGVGDIGKCFHGLAFRCSGPSRDRGTQWPRRAGTRRGRCTDRAALGEEACDACSAYVANCAYRDDGRAV